MKITETFHLNACIDIKMDVTSDASPAQKSVDARRAFSKWAKKELNIPSFTFRETGVPYGTKLDIDSYGEFEVYDLKDVNVEIY